MIAGYAKISLRCILSDKTFSLVSDKYTFFYAGCWSRSSTSNPNANFGYNIFKMLSLSNLSNLIRLNVYKQIKRAMLLAAEQFIQNIVIVSLSPYSYYCRDRFSSVFSLLYCNFIIIFTFCPLGVICCSAALPTW